MKLIRKIRPDRQSFKDWCEILKNVFQIVAIMIAGYWTWHLFRERDAPSLEVRGSASSVIHWYPIKPGDQVQLAFDVDLQNSGVKSFDIAKIVVKTWEFDVGTADGLNFLDVRKIKSQRAVEQEYDLTDKGDRSFPSHYPPGASLTNTFEWTGKPNCQKWILLQAEFYTKKDSTKPDWSTSAWHQQCPP